MMRRLGIQLLAGVILLAAGFSARAAEPPDAGKAAFVFDQAIQSYLKGDSPQAIRQLDESLHLNPENQQAKVFLLKLLVERGSRLFLAKQYAKAYEYLSRAYHMDSTNEQVRQMFDLAANQVKPQAPSNHVMLIPNDMRQAMLKQDAANQVRRQGAPEVTLERAPDASRKKADTVSQQAPMPVYAEPAPMGQPGAPADPGPGMVLTEEYAKNVSAMMSLLATFQDRQERQLSQFMAPLERIQHLYYQSEEDRKKFINQLDAKFGTVLGNVSFQQRMMIYGFIAGLGLLSVLVWGFFMVVRRMRSKREETIMKYQQEMLKMVRDMAGLPGGYAYAALPPTAGGLRLTGPTPQLMAGSGSWTTGQAAGGPSGQETQAVEGVLGTPPELAVQLEEQTRQGNVKERALSAMQLLQVDAEKAQTIIRTLLQHSDPFQRENMAHALGERYHPLIEDLLVSAVQDQESRVAVAAQRSWRRWEQLPDEQFPVDARARIRNALAKPSGKPGGKKKRPPRI